MKNVIKCENKTEQNSFFKIDIRKEYQKRIGIAYADCSNERREQIISDLRMSRFENDFRQRMVSYFLVHIFMLGLQNVPIRLLISEEMTYNFTESPCYADKMLEEIMSVYTWRYHTTGMEDEIRISFSAEDAIWIKYDSMLVAASCCREIYQWIANKENSTLLVDTGSALTRRPKKGRGYYSLSFADDEILYERNIEDIDIYVDCAAAFITGFEINPIKIADKENIIIGAGAGASRMIAKALVNMDLNSLEKVWAYLVDPVSEFRHWEDMYDVEVANNKNICPICAVVILSRLTRGIGCQTAKEAYQLVASCKRYLQEIFAIPDKVKKVTVLYCINEFFGNAFSIQCAKFLQNLGIEVILLPIQVIPWRIMSEEKRSMVQDVTEIISKLVLEKERISIQLDNAETRFYNTMRGVIADDKQIDEEQMKKYSFLLYQDSEAEWIQKIRVMVEGRQQEK